MGVPTSDSKLCELYQSWYEDRAVDVDHAAFWREMVPSRVNHWTPCNENSGGPTPSSLFHSKFRMGSRLCNEAYRVAQVSGMAGLEDDDRLMVRGDIFCQLQ